MKISTALSRAPERSLKKTLILCAGFLMAPVVLVAQMTHTWVRNDEISPDIWSWTANWDTNTAPANGDSLIFDGNYAYTANDLTNLLLRQITFAETAGVAFELDGNLIRVGGKIVNDSAYEVYIGMPIQIVEGGGAIPYSWGGTGQGLIFDIGPGGMTVAGDITVNNGARVFAKEGKGTLTLTGNNVTTFTMIRNGTLIQDGGTLGQTGSDWQRRLTFGALLAADQPQNMGTGTLILRNGATAVFNNIELFSYGGASSIVIEAGSALTADSIGYAGASYGEGNSGNTPLATLNIDLSDGGTSTSGSGTGFLGGRNVTVTELVSGERKTGFAYTVTGNVVRATPHITDIYTGGALTWVSGYETSRQYITSGHTVADGQVWLGSMTITGSGEGSISGVPTTVFSLQSFLMEEGTGNYLVDKQWTASGESATRYVHQYSTDGVLTFGQNINGNAHFVKTGPGTVVLAAGRSANTNLQTEIQGGRFVLDGSFGSTTHFRVRGSDAILSGQGSIGGTGGTVYTGVQIFNGGTLEGNHHDAKALDITGSLTILSDGNYLVNLKESPAYDVLTVVGTSTDAEVNLAGNLILTLDYAYAGTDPIILLRTDGTISGTFDFINGAAINGFVHPYLRG